MPTQTMSTIERNAFSERVKRYNIAGVYVRMSAQTAAAWEAGRYRHGMTVEAMPGPGGWPECTQGKLPAAIRDRMDGYPAEPA